MCTKSWFETTLSSSAALEIIQLLSGVIWTQRSTDFSNQHNIKLSLTTDGCSSFIIATGGFDEGLARRRLIPPLVLYNMEQTSAQMDGRPIQKHSYVILMLPKLSSIAKLGSYELTWALDHVFHVKVYYKDITLCILSFHLSLSILHFNFPPPSVAA